MNTNDVRFVYKQQDGRMLQQWNCMSLSASRFLLLFLRIWEPDLQAPASVEVNGSTQRRSELRFKPLACAKLVNIISWAAHLKLSITCLASATFEQLSCEGLHQCLQVPAGRCPEIAYHSPLHATSADDLDFSCFSSWTTFAALCTQCKTG